MFPDDGRSISRNVAHILVHGIVLWILNRQAKISLCIEDSVFVYKPFDKRAKFSLFIVRMPHLSSNIPSIIPSGSTFSELLWIARCPLRTFDFILWASDLLSRMIA